MDPADGSIYKKTTEDFLNEWSGIIILLLPEEDFTKTNSVTTNSIRFWQLIQPHKGIMFQALLGAIVYTIMGLATSVYVQKIIDFVIPEGNHRLLNLLSVTMIFLLLFQMFIGCFKTILGLQTGQYIDARLILGYYKHLTCCAIRN